MQIAERFSFNNGFETVQSTFPTQLEDVCSVIHSVDADKHESNYRRVKTKSRKVVHSLKKLKESFHFAFTEKGNWKQIQVTCESSTEHSAEDGLGKPVEGAIRSLDFVKDKLGVEVQFGKYAFMVYNVCAKMTIFRNLGHITHGIEIVPMKTFAEGMSSGISYFEQFVWDLNQRGVADIDIPVLILGIDA